MYIYIYIYVYVYLQIYIYIYICIYMYIYILYLARRASGLRFALRNINLQVHSKNFGLLEKQVKRPDGPQNKYTSLHVTAVYGMMGP